MKRSGFKRLQVVHMPPTPAKRLERPVVFADCSVMQQPQVKPEPWRDAHLLSMARGRPCLLLSRVCNFDSTTTVAAHSNLLAHGKGRGRKADDCYSVWACARCHAWLDGSYDAEFEEKEAAFMRALIAQKDEWAAIAESATAPAKDRFSARGALKQLQQTAKEAA